MKSENISSSTIPQHIAIIPDGNRRWAKQTGVPSVMGHKKGAENFDLLIEKARELGVKCFTGWAFSTENWKRPEDEITFLFDLTRKLTEKYMKKCLEEKIRFVHLGRKDRLPQDIVKTIGEMEEKTKHFTDFTVALGMDYGGHDELIRTMKILAEKGLEVTKENIESNLDTRDLPYPDLIIRTGGEKRLSGFMSWQSEYAEFYFTDMYFPDFNPDELANAVSDFGSRERRFGGNSSK